jgi:peptidoglycan hydrolase-like protein with peptidoglycan-binding domain/3D (Asp-Asp-Asp) domain-containing protein
LLKKGFPPCSKVWSFYIRAKTLILKSQVFFYLNTNFVLRNGIFLITYKEVVQLQDFSQTKNHIEMTTKTAKIIGCVAIAIQLLTLMPVNVSASGGESRKFLVTGYYSPLPDQPFYVRGSYEADVRLNGRGTNGADGSQVYIGMLAAPKTYSFGTKIFIPGLGIGGIHDRGGAIITGKDYDRIDVWMGRGEEGLARALNWGARVVQGEIYDDFADVEEAIDYSWIGSTLPEKMVNRLKGKTLQNPAVFDKPMTEKSGKDDIEQLQEALTTFGYYHGAIDGVYSADTRGAVVAFQLTEGVIPNSNSQGAGNFGPKTRAVLKERLENFNSEVIKEQKRLEANRMLLAAGLGKNAEGDDVVALQRMLWELGYYDGQLTGEYDSKTIDAVFQFQKAYGVIDSDNDKGAGYYGKKTHEALTAAVDEKIEKVGKYPMQLQVWMPAKIELPQIASLTSPEISMVSQEIYFEPELMNKKIVHASATLGMTISDDLDLDDHGDDVVQLQNILIKNGYLAAGLNTGLYGAKTKEAVLKFQLEKGIVASGNDTGAGRVGPKTRSVLNSL